MKSAREQLEDANTRLREEGKLCIPDNGAVPQEGLSTREFPDGEQWASDLSGGATSSGDTATPRDATEGAPSRRLVYTRMSDVAREELRWLWPDRFPMGKLTVLAGMQGLGKSFVALDMAARISTGAAWPDTPDEPNPIGSVLLLTAEDGLGDTVRKRIDDAGADAARIVAVQGTTEKDHGLDQVSIADDIHMLSDLADEIGDVRLVIIDPLTAYLGGGTDIHRDNSVRDVLAPMANFAERHGVAVVAVMHLRKSGSDDALYRVLGSVAFTALARSVWMIGNRPGGEDDRARVFVNSKMNLAVPAGALGFSIVAPGLVEWAPDPLNVTAQEVFAASGIGHPDESAPQVAAAVEWLQELLADGQIEAKDAKRQAGDNSIAPRTLTRARAAAGVRSRKNGFTGKWYWSLSEAAEDAPT
ncbi:MAG: AAA family ATPase [Planctomycetes bacterium]|nr:AAA family ATPase [Planctomycetota bacterium]